MGTTRDNSNFDSGHIQIAFLKFSAFYIFFPFLYRKKSNALGLLCIREVSSLLSEARMAAALVIAGEESLSGERRKRKEKVKKLH